MIELKYIMKVKFIKSFRDLSKKDIHTAGGKGASLGEMTQAGLSVPPGFVVLASAFDEFLKQTPHPKGAGQADLNIVVQSELNKINYNDIMTNEIKKTRYISCMSKDKMKTNCIT